MRGENRDECNAPVGDWDNASVCREQGTVLHQLLSPLWTIQHDVIHELLGRAGGDSRSNSGAAWGR